jgi:ubiquinone/menaquinone biosynthesis C-methylase UbiE
MANKVDSVNNYDKIAGVYDLFSRLIFFKTQVKAQTDQLTFIPANSNILIVGGGTGWILEEIAKIHSKSLSITYIEISAKMIRLARKRNVKHNNVKFINCAIEAFNGIEHYDVIHTAFLFDNFEEKRLESVFEKLNTLLKPGGLWLFTDFSYQPKTDQKWKGILLKLMYAFFKRIAKVEATRLIDTSTYFTNNFYENIKESDYYQNFIKAIVYRKMDPKKRPFK